MFIIYYNYASVHASLIFDQYAWIYTIERRIKMMKIIIVIFDLDLKNDQTNIIVIFTYYVIKIDFYLVILIKL